MASSIHCKSIIARCTVGLRRVNDLKVAACMSWMQHRPLSTKFPEFQNNPQLQSHDQIYKFSLENPDQFWSSLARSRLQWSRDFDTIKDCDISKGHIKWFLGGQLNASGNLKLIFLAHRDKVLGSLCYTPRVGVWTLLKFFGAGPVSVIT